MNVSSAHTYDRSKRVFDIVLGITGLCLTAPLQLAIATSVGFRLGRPIFFRQERPGKNGTPFVLVKFRTMLPENSGLSSDAQRLTPFGRTLRSTSMDELPSLWNVVKGEMSVVGPRPLRTHYLPLYTPRQARRHEVKPGLTGLAQIGGRNRLPWSERLELDVEYVENRSLHLDAYILLRTVGVVLGRKGISAENEATMYPYTGVPDVQIS